MALCNLHPIERCFHQELFVIPNERVLFFLDI
jgi:hypothetical protein